MIVIITSLPIIRIVHLTFPRNLFSLNFDLGKLYSSFYKLLLVFSRFCDLICSIPLPYLVKYASQSKKPSYKYYILLCKCSCLSKVGDKSMTKLLIVDQKNLRFNSITRNEYSRIQMFIYQLFFVLWSLVFFMKKMNDLLAYLAKYGRKVKYEYIFLFGFSSFTICTDCFGFSVIHFYSFETSNFDL